MRPTDEQLVEAFQNGDAAAFDTLLGRWDLKIRGAIYRLVGPHEDVRDLCQETFLKAYRGLGGFKKEARFSSWLYQIAVNVCRDRQRRRRGRTLVSLDELEANEARVPSASALVEGRDLSRLVAAAVEALPADQREVIVLKEYQGLTFLEIADTLDLPISTVKTRLYRGLGQLRQRLERQGIRAAAPIAAPIP
jgi:RNA polymerase sigma-70 factor (ECF subfamily)